MEDRTYRLQEMLESMSNAIDNANEVKDQQNDLIQLIESSKDVEKFEKFIEELKEQIKDIEQQLTKLESRKEFLAKVVDECKHNDIKEVVNYLIYALGMFE